MRPLVGTVSADHAADERGAAYCPACGYDLRGLMVDRCPECGLEGAVTAAAPDPYFPRRRTGKRLCLGVIAGACLLGGALEGAIALGVPAPTRAVWLVLGLAMMLGSLLWYRCDRGLRRYRPEDFQGLLIMLVPPVGLAWYFATYRRWWSLAKCAAFAVVLRLASELVAWLVVSLF